jgi:hypothetical protein
MKKILQKFWGKLKIYILNLVFKWIKKPIIDKKIKNVENEKINIEKHNFETSFKVKVDDIKKLMTATNYNYDENEIKKINDLVEGAKSINENKKYISPLFYDPKIIDIHNESLGDRVGPTMRQIMMEDDKKVSDIMVYQKRVLDNGVQVYPTSIASKMTYKPYKRKEKVVENRKINLSSEDIKILFEKANTRIIHE